MNQFILGRTVGSLPTIRAIEQFKLPLAQMTDQNPNADPWSPAAKIPHSSLGLASFSLAVLGQLLIWGAGFFIAAYAVYETTEEEPSDDRFELLLSGSGMVIALGTLLNLVALPLGLLGSFKRDRRHLFTILGLAISVLTVLGTGAVILLSMRGVDAG